jgi:ATP-dependent Lon protease
MTGGKDELAAIEDKIRRTKLSKEAREKARHELKKLRQMSPMSAEATVVRDYLDWLLSIPLEQEDRGQQGPVARAGDPRQRPLRAGRRSRSASSSILLSSSASTS